MADVLWLEAAARRRIDPRVQVMHPAEIDYNLLEEPVRDFVRALNTTAVVETLGSCGGHPFEAASGAPSIERRAHSAYVLLHVLDESGWRDLALAIAGDMRSIPGLSMSVTFDHEAQLRLVVEPRLRPIVRRVLLDQSLAGAAGAVMRWKRCGESLAGD